MKEAKDLLSQLKNEHDIIKSLLEEAESCSEDEREEVLGKIEQNLVPHARAEEKSFYAVIKERADQKNNDEAIDLANEGYEEHRVVDKMLADLKKKSVTDEKWSALLEVIKENLEHHIKEEEEEIFEEAKKLFTKNELQELLKAYCSLKERFETSLPTQGQISEQKIPPEVDQSLGGAL